MQGLLQEMKKLIILILMLILPYSVSALDLCQDAPQVKKNCAMATPTISQCTNFSYNIYNTSGTLIQTGTMTLLKEDIYYFNLTMEEGKYIIRLCDGATREVIVFNDPNIPFYLYIIASLTLVTLLGLGFYLHEGTFVILGGMLAIIISVDIFIGGFPNLTDEFLKNTMSIVFGGIGFLFVLLPSLEFFENMGWSL